MQDRTDPAINAVGCCRPIIIMMVKNFRGKDINLGKPFPRRQNTQPLTKDISDVKDGFGFVVQHWTLEAEIMYTVTLNRKRYFSTSILRHNHVFTKPYQGHQIGQIISTGAS